MASRAAWGSRHSPLIAAPLYLGTAFAGSPFVIGGSIKIVYVLRLYRAFRAVRPPEEREPRAPDA
jgi:hypothetical protein